MRPGCDVRRVSGAAVDIVSRRVVAACEYMGPEGGPACTDQGEAGIRRAVAGISRWRHCIFWMALGTGIPSSLTHVHALWPSATVAKNLARVGRQAAGVMTSSHWMKRATTQWTKVPPSNVHTVRRPRCGRSFLGLLWGFEGALHCLMQDNITRHQRLPHTATHLPLSACEA